MHLHQMFGTEEIGAPKFSAFKGLGVQGFWRVLRVLARCKVLPASL
jgi:hypothetical protein